MSTSITGQGSSASQHLRTTKKVLQDVILNAGTASATADKAEVDDLERDALEILRLIRSLKNRLAPVSRIPPEVLTLIPDFLHMCSRDRNVIALTHVCRGWREMFISRSSLWSNFDCANADKTRVYLERSGSSPINLQLCRGRGLSSLDTFLQIVPQAIGRLKFLSIDTRPRNLEAITAHLSHPAPLLETLAIDGGCRHEPWHNPVIASTIFNGDLSSLRVLRLGSVRAELLWRNMTNLASFTLHHSSISNFGNFLDFLESAPRLREIDLFLTTLIFGRESGRLVSLDHLERMVISSCGPTSILLDHLVIPVGANLITQPNPGSFIVEDHIPRSLGNLKNLSNFTEIHLCLHKYLPRMEFSGPNGKFCIVPRGINPTSLAFESLARFDTSRTKQLNVYSHCDLSRDLAYRVLLPMKDLRIIVLYRCGDLPRAFMDALNPNTSPSKEVVCPSLEELSFIFHIRGYVEEFDVQAVIEMAAARASRGVKLRAVRDQVELDPRDVLELRKHVLRVEHGREALCDSGSDYSDEED